MLRSRRLAFERRHLPLAAGHVRQFATNGQFAQRGPDRRRLLERECYQPLARRLGSAGVRTGPRR
jgi:hypothetical protein